MFKLTKGANGWTYGQIDSNYIKSFYNFRKVSLSKKTYLSTYEQDEPDL